MSAQRKEQGEKHLLSSARERKGAKTMTTTLPPKNYIHMKENEQIKI